VVSLRFLLDTSTLSEPMRPSPNVRLMRRMRIHTGQLAIAATTWHEALFGLHRMPEGNRKQTVHEYLFNVVAPAVPILPYDEASAEWHAREQARLAAQGHTAPFADGQIAAVAKVRGLTIVTENARDFEPFEGLTVESWRR
jgi:tRNA(fMet)-specific endonuclease VapC